MLSVKEVKITKQAKEVLNKCRCRCCYSQNTGNTRRSIVPVTVQIQKITDMLLRRKYKLRKNHEVTFSKVP